MNLSRNFSLHELIKSDTAIRKGIDNNPNPDQIDKLKVLCEKVLQPVRDHFGRVKVTSGFRSPELCQAIGSSVNSQHAKAEAADFEVIGTDNSLLRNPLVTLTLPKWSRTGCKIFSHNNFNFSICSALGLLLMPLRIAVSDLINSDKVKLRERFIFYFFPIIYFFTIFSTLIKACIS